MNNILNYLTEILGKEVKEKSVISLTSAQKMKFYHWLNKRGYIFKESLLGSNFTLTELIGQDGEAVNVPIRPNGESPNPYIFDSGNDLKNIDSLSVGIDVQEIDEFFAAGFPRDPKSCEFLTGVLSFEEISYAQSQPNIKQTLVGLFAAKEAIIKCRGEVVDLRDIEIKHFLSGKPYSPGFLVSISHSRNFVVAIAIKYKNYEINNLSNIAKRANIKELRHKKPWLIYLLFVIQIITISWVIYK